LDKRYGGNRSEQKRHSVRRKRHGVVTANGGIETHGDIIINDGTDPLSEGASSEGDPSTEIPVVIVIDSEDGDEGDIIITVTEGGTIAEPKAPEKDGYTFGGWISDPECTIPYSRTFVGKKVSQKQDHVTIIKRTDIRFRVSVLSCFSAFVSFFFTVNAFSQSFG
jgi:hypothetical protein